MSTDVIRNEAESRYDIVVDGERAGLAAYRDHTLADGSVQRIFFHTEIDAAFGGRGLSSALVRAALEDTKAAGLRFAPVCPLVKGWTSKHADFDDIKDPVTAEVLEALR